jgi:hypothetical protein
MEIMMDYSRDCVNSLYRTTMWIRNPTTRSVSSKALEYKDIDKDTGKDLLAAYIPFDRDFVSSVLSYRAEMGLMNSERNSHSTEDQPLQTSDKGEKSAVCGSEQALVGPSDDLVNRLAQGNYRRRQQLAYWRSHKEKLDDYYARSSAEGQIPLPPPPIHDCRSTGQSGSGQQPRPFHHHGNKTGS